MNDEIRTNNPIKITFDKGKKNTRQLNSNNSNDNESLPNEFPAIPSNSNPPHVNNNLVQNANQISFSSPTFPMSNYSAAATAPPSTPASTEQSANLNNSNYQANSQCSYLFRQMNSLFRPQNMMPYGQYTWSTTVGNTLGSGDCQTNNYFHAPFQAPNQFSNMSFKKNFQANSNFGSGVNQTKNFKGPMEEKPDRDSIRNSRNNRNRNANKIDRNHDRESDRRRGRGGKHDNYNSNQWRRGLLPHPTSVAQGSQQSFKSGDKQSRYKNRKRKNVADLCEDFDMAREEAIKEEREKRQAVQRRREMRRRNPDDYWPTKKRYKSRSPSPELPPVPKWIRSSPATLYFESKDGKTFSTERMQQLETKFQNDVISRAEIILCENDKVQKQEDVLPKMHFHSHKGCCSQDNSDILSHSDSSDESDKGDNDEPEYLKEMMRKQQHPQRLHKEAWYNDSLQLNTGPICKCSLTSRKHGIRHDIYPGEEPVPKCVQDSNCSDVLYHYRIAVSPYNNFLTGNPTVIVHDEREYTFEGFSILSHKELALNIPPCMLSRYGFLYRIHFFKEEPLQNYDIRTLDLFSKFLFFDILELVDLDWLRPNDDCCPLFHIMPRFTRMLPENGKEILSMNEVLSYLVKSAKPLVDVQDLPRIKRFTDTEWMEYVDRVRGSLVTNPKTKPTSVRIDQLDRVDRTSDGFPILIHFGARPAQLSYMGDTQYQRLSREVMKLRHLYSNKPKVTREEKRSLADKEEKLKNMKLKSELKKEVTIEVSSKGFFRTGLNCDVCQHALLLPVLITHLRFHQCLTKLEENIGYYFKDRSLLQLAVTHPSYRPHYGTNPDHVRNTLSNCGIRHTEYGDKENMSRSSRKRGITTLIHIMSMMGKKEKISSEVDHYERLEFLGDAIIEFITSIRLFYMFPELDEGGLAMYRSALVCNQHLAVLAKRLKLDDYMLYAHGPDLCHRSELRHAMANSFEALMGAIFLDESLQTVDRVFSQTLWENDPVLRKIWDSDRKHQLQNEFPKGDRHLIESSPILQKLEDFENSSGIKYRHIRLLAKALTLKSVSYNWLTRGHNQRLEFLGDTVLQLVSSVFLYLHFPNHHEGHLSLLRSSLVNAKTQAQVACEIGLPNFIIANDKHINLNKAKALADLLEAYIGAMYVDQGINCVKVFCNVCFFPRLEEFIIHQKWNDPKSQLQQCCITLRDVGGGDPEIPVYKEISRFGPTNRRCFKVAVYFKSKRLAIGQGRCLREAQMDAAKNALDENSELFPQIKYQRRIVQQKYNLPKDSSDKNDRRDFDTSRDTRDRNILPKQYAENSNDFNDKSDDEDKNKSNNNCETIDSRKKLQSSGENRKLPFAPINLDDIKIDESDEQSFSPDTPKISEESKEFCTTFIPKSVSNSEEEIAVDKNKEPEKSPVVFKFKKTFKPMGTSALLKTYSKPRTDQESEDDCDVNSDQKTDEKSEENYTCLATDGIVKVNINEIKRKRRKNRKVQPQNNSQNSRSNSENEEISKLMEQKIFSFQTNEDNQVSLPCDLKDELGDKDLGKINESPMNSSTEEGEIKTDSE